MNFGKVPSAVWTGIIFTIIFVSQIIFGEQRVNDVLQSVPVLIQSAIAILLFIAKAIEVYNEDKRGATARDVRKDSKFKRWLIG